MPKPKYRITADFGGKEITFLTDSYFGAYPFVDKHYVGMTFIDFTTGKSVTFSPSVPLLIEEL